MSHFPWLPAGIQTRLNPVVQPKAHLLLNEPMRALRLRPISADYELAAYGEAIRALILSNRRPGFSTQAEALLSGLHACLPHVWLSLDAEGEVLGLSVLRTVEPHQACLDALSHLDREPRRSYPAVFSALHALDFAFHGLHLDRVHACVENPEAYAFFKALGFRADDAAARCLAKCAISRADYIEKYEKENPHVFRTQAKQSPGNQGAAPGDDL